VRVALVLPPTTQLNTPYPSTAYLARRLRSQDGVSVIQRDLGLDLVLRVFSRAGLDAIFDAIEAAADGGLPEPAWRALALRERHLAVIEPVVRFLQGRDSALAWRLSRPGLLPGGPRLDRAEPARFGVLGQHDLARYRATLYLEDVADLVTATVDPGFGIAQYQHHLAHGPVSFAPIAARLEQTTLLDGWLDEEVDKLLAHQPDVVGLSVPFPGTLYGALRIGRRARAAGVPVVMGGGYVNTELREVQEPRLWDCVDALTYDDGEEPLVAILEHMVGGPDRRHRTRTADAVYAAPADGAPAPKAVFNPAPWYGDLPLGDYLQVLDTLNPAHRLWSDGRWNKVTLAHGCYWRRCAFCDVNLDYISRFEPARMDELVDAMAELVEETGDRGFHLVDEAAPPRLLRDLALRLLDRDLRVVFWGNIRFEKAFTEDLARLLAAAGMVGVSGGLEVASDRVLRLMDKGVTIDQAARAASAFTDAGVLVHGYLMYGFPTETAQEHVDAMEVVRQLFVSGALSSAFWHRFVLTRHSRVFTDPSAFGVQFTVPEGVFALNDLPHVDPVGADPDPFDGPLAQSLSAWMAGRDLARPVHKWFPRRTVPATTISPTQVAGALVEGRPAMPDSARLIWLGDGLLESDEGVVLLHAEEQTAISGPGPVLEWLAEVLDAAVPGGEGLTAGEAKAAFPGDWRRWARQWAAVREAGLVGV
jgi:radical SAM superfamily enzyme YgiQ (UPF0313 family)